MPVKCCDQCCSASKEWCGNCNSNSREWCGKCCSDSKERCGSCNRWCDTRCKLCGGWCNTECKKCGGWCSTECKKCRDYDYRGKTKEGCYSCVKETQMMIRGVGKYEILWESWCGAPVRNCAIAWCVILFTFGMTVTVVGSIFYDFKYISGRDSAASVAPLIIFTSVLHWLSGLLGLLGIVVKNHYVLRTAAWGTVVGGIFASITVVVYWSFLARHHHYAVIGFDTGWDMDETVGVGTAYACNYILTISAIVHWFTMGGVFCSLSSLATLYGPEFLLVEVSFDVKFDGSDDRSTVSEGEEEDCC